MKRGTLSRYVHHHFRFFSMIIEDLQKLIERRQKHSRGFSHHDVVQAINRELSRSQRFQQQFALLLLDIPGSVPHGVHKVLPGKTLGVKHLEDQVRPYDTVTEVGLRRYMVILPQTELAGTAVVKERIRALARQHGWGEVRIGLAVYPENGNTGDLLLQWAKFDLQREEEIKEQDIKLVRHLVDSGRINRVQLAQAVEYQRAQHAPLGKLAVQKGYLTEAQAEKIVEYQHEKHALFGEAAVKLKYLTQKQVEELLESQKVTTALVSDALIALGMLTKEERNAEAMVFAQHNSKRQV
ncbi:MAG: hypothetical protein HY731_06415 [Candidatus Tectomicrobia bacterium]|nr:hypothetical protein [Candidatus Tectomicrobia bacterium]